MNLLRRFSLLCAVALGVLTIILGYLITSFQERNALQNVKNYLAEHIAHDARRQLTEADFRKAKTGPEYEDFWERIIDILDLPQTLMTVFYSPDGTVVWSDEESLVGSRNGDPELYKALRGKVSAVIVPLKGEKEVAGRKVREVMEIHVPIAFGDRTRVAGVIEICQSLDVLRADIRRTKTVVWGTMGAGFVVVYLLLFGMVREGHRLIGKHQEELQRSREKLVWHRMELLHRIGAAAVSEAGIDTVLEEVARDIRRLLELPRCTIRLFGDPDKVIEDHEPEFPSALSLFPERFKDFRCWPMYEGGATVVVPDVRKCCCYQELGEALEKSRLGSFLAVPLYIRETLSGLLFLERGEPHAWPQDEIATAEAVAQQASMAIRHVQVFQEQQELAGRLLALMNNVPGVVYRGLPDWTMPLVGADIERIGGHPAEAFTSGSIVWRDLIPPDDLAGIRERIREAVRAGERVLRLEYRIRHRDGSVRWISDRRQMIYGPDGRLAYVDGLALDITARKKSEEALRLTQFSVDRAGDATYWMGPDGRLIYANEQACRTLGCTREELLTMTVHDINPDYTTAVWPTHWENVRRRKGFTFESRHKAKDGRIIPVEITVNYIEFDGKEYNCVTARDITERLRVQEESRQLQAQLLQAQKMEAMGLLAGGIAHDFNNLLTGILGYANLLVRADGGAVDATAAAAAIQNAAERASQLTAQLLGFARKGKNLTVPVDMNIAVDDVCMLLDHTMDKRIRIVRQLHPVSAVVVGDPTQLQQVIMNLAVNAGEAMPEGGCMIIATDVLDLDETYCRARPGTSPGRYVVLTVSDSGIGIHPDNLEKIFDPFFTTKERGKGTGLGLSMVFGIIKNHGGFIDVESRPGFGTTFTAFLPASTDGHAAAPEARMSLPSPGLCGGRGRILLVDDQDAVREVCCAMLRTLGYEVVTASDGYEGVERYRSLWREIDLVIIDMIMPNLGGRDCFKRIRLINPNVRAVLSTGYSMEGAVQEILREGMVGFIQKPYRLDQLAEIVSQAMERVN